MGASRYSNIYLKIFRYSVWSKDIHQNIACSTYAYATEWISRLLPLPVLPSPPNGFHVTECQELGFYLLPPTPSDAAISLIERSRTNGSSLDCSKPRRCQNSAASLSTALTIKARPPISEAA